MRDEISWMTSCDQRKHVVLSLYVQEHKILLHDAASFEPTDPLAPLKLKTSVGAVVITILVGIYMRIAWDVINDLKETKRQFDMVFCIWEIKGFAIPTLDQSNHKE